MAGKSESTRVEVHMPDDFHHHLRDGPQLASIAPVVATSFANMLVMPNLKPPVRTVDEAAAYRDRILGYVDRERFPLFNPMMTLYLTNTTTPEEIIRAKQSGYVYAVKYYPAGATTNSEFGVTSIDSLTPVFQVRLLYTLPLSFLTYAL
jgi:dihydroorotase